MAAFLAGSHVTGTADAYSDLDLGVITTDEAYEDFCAEAEDFVRRLGTLLFLETFDVPSNLFFVLGDGTEGDLAVGREGQFHDLHGEPYRVLLDKTQILLGANLVRSIPPAAEQGEALRRLVYWFWHDLSHFIAAIARGHAWWAYGQLEQLRRQCVNLARLRQDFTDRTGGYDKVDLAIPSDQLARLAATICPVEAAAMLQAALRVVRLYRDLAPGLARAHGISYPAELDRMISARLEALCKSRSR